MRKWKSSLLVILMAVAALSQTATELESTDVNRVAARLNCDCGCKLNMACKMPPDGRCPVCQRNKAKILSMQKAGMSDELILASYVKEMGKDVLVVEPGASGFAGPYVALGLGFLAVLFVIRRYMKQKPALAGGGEVDPETLAKIEKETANLD